MKTFFALLSFVSFSLTSVSIIELRGKIEDISCLKDVCQGSIYLRGLEDNGQVDPYLKDNIVILGKENYNFAAYMQPCFKCGDPRKQAQDIKSAMPSKINTYLIHVIPGQWGLDITANRLFLSVLVNELEINSNEVEIMTNEAFYEKVVGKDFDSFHLLKLVYYKPNDKETCKDFITFNGWKKAYSKIFSVDNKECGLSLDYISKCQCRSGPNFINIKYNGFVVGLFSN